jgi:hypothetical protein
VVVRLFESVATALLSICIGLASVPAVASPFSQFNTLASAIHGARFGGESTPPPTLSITTSTVSAPVDSDFTLSWSSNYADSCMASGSWEGDRAPSGTETIAGAVAGVNTYVLTCSGASGERSARITVEITGTKPAAPSNALFIGHSFFAPIAREMPFHAALLGLDEYSQHVEFSGGETGQPLALWEDAEHRQNIQAVLDTGEVDTFGMTYGSDESGYQLWIDYALSKNPDTRFVLGIPWLDYPGDYDTAEYSSTYAEGIETLLSGQYGNLRALYPDVDIVFMPYGLAAVELRYALDAGQLPGVINLIGDNAATSLFKDQKGHGHKSGLLLDLAEFIWLDVIFGVDLETYDYDSGHSVNLKETAQSIFDEYPHYFVE